MSLLADTTGEASVRNYRGGTDSRELPGFYIQSGARKDKILKQSVGNTLFAAKIGWFPVPARSGVAHRSATCRVIGRPNNRGIAHKLKIGDSSETRKGPCSLLDLVRSFLIIQSLFLRGGNIEK